MKKWTILVIVSLAAALLIMQYVLEKRKGPAQEGGPPTQAVEQPVGVSLPEGATAYAARQAENLIPQAGEGAGYGGGITLPIQSAYKGACQGGSLGEMMATHDKYWGFFARNTAFNQEETQKMYSFLSDYAGCHASARADVSLCDSLPGPAEKGGYKVTLDKTPAYACRKKTVIMLFEAYMAGSISGESYCRLEMSGWPREDLDKIPAPDFCAAAAKGPGPAAAFLVKIFPANAKEIRESFPTKEADCGGTASCLARLGLYKSFKSGRAKDCPGEYAASCQAQADRSTAPCDKVLWDMSQFYCASVSRVKKATGGYIGMSKEEIAADIEKTKAARAEADNMKKEQEKLQAEVNKRVKKILKKN